MNLGLKTGVARSSVRLAHDVVWLAHYDVKPFKLCLEAVISSTQVHRQLHLRQCLRAGLRGVNEALRVALHVHVKL